MLGEGIERSSLNAGGTFGVGQSTVDEEIGITADGGGEVGVGADCQRIVPVARGEGEGWGGAG